MLPEKKDRSARKFISTRRAVTEYCLEPDQLLDLPTTVKRSPFDCKSTIKVYNRKDVIKRDLINAWVKAVAYIATKSDIMFAETVHSIADTVNEIILLCGVCQARKGPSSMHPYGRSSFMYVSALIAGVCIFCLGGGLSIYSGAHSFIHGSDIINEIQENKEWVVAVLLFSFTSELVTFCLSVKAAIAGAKASQISLYRYIWRSVEPGISVVLLEDMVAVLGICLAFIMLVLTWQLGDSKWDSIGSIFIGLLLWAVSAMLIFTNARALVGRSVPKELLEKINRTLEADEVVRAVFDVKGIEMGDKLRYKAEIDIDGSEITKLYVRRVGIGNILHDLKKVVNTSDAEAFMFKHGECIVDLMGEQIDRIERNLMAAFPKIRHVDLEIL